MQSIFQEINLSLNLNEKLNLDKIIQERREAYNVLFNVLGPDNIGIMEAKFGLAKALMDAGEYEEALPLLVSLDEEVRKKDAQGHDLFVFEDLQVTLASAYVLTGHNDEAASYITGLLEDKSRWIRAMDRPSLSVRIYMNLWMMLADIHMRKQNFNESFAAVIELLKARLEYDDAYSSSMRKYYEFACRLFTQVDKDELKDDFDLLTDDILDTFEEDIGYYSDAFDKITDDEEGIFDTLDLMSAITCLHNALQYYSDYLVNVMICDEARRTPESYELLNITLQQLILIYNNYADMFAPDEEYDRDTEDKTEKEIRQSIDFMSVICSISAKRLQDAVDMLDVEDISSVDLEGIRSIMNTCRKMGGRYFSHDLDEEDDEAIISEAEAENDISVNDLAGFLHHIFDDMKEEKEDKPEKKSAKKEKTEKKEKKETKPKKKKTEK